MLSRVPIGRNPAWTSRSPPIEQGNVLLRIIDAHLHLSSKASADAGRAAAVLDAQLAAKGIDHAVVLHLLSQPWSAEEFAEAISSKKRLHGFINVDPRSADAARDLRRGVEQFGFVGLKLHPRLQKFDLDDPATHRLVAAAGEMNVPVLVDAFPDGDWLMQGFSALAFARLAKNWPDTKLIIAHFGGHHCIDFLMLAKRLPNIWFDLSYSLLYYSGSSVIDDLLYCCRSMKYRRVFYGSDYPDRSIADTVEKSLATLQAGGIEPEDLDRLLYLNALEFFGWPGN